jgi:CBS-domain-containing membrane protein
MGLFITGVLIALAARATAPWQLITSCGGTAVLVAMFPSAEMSRPHRIVCSHIIGAATGLMLAALFGPTWWNCGIAVAVVSMLMAVTDTMHPPGVSSALLGLVSLHAAATTMLQLTAAASLLAAFAWIWIRLTQTPAHSAGQEE